MPIYEYRCQSCNHDLEVMQKLSDPELSDCPACGQPQLKKLISAVGFRLKGSGWYETDFKKGNQKNVAKDEAPKESSSSSACDGAGGVRRLSSAGGSLVVSGGWLTFGL